MWAEYCLDEVICRMRMVLRTCVSFSGGGRGGRSRVDVSVKGSTVSRSDGYD